MKDFSSSNVMKPEEDGEVREITAKEAQRFFGEAPARLATIADLKSESRKKSVRSAESIQSTDTSEMVVAATMMTHTTSESILDMKMWSNHDWNYPRRTLVDPEVMILGDL